MTTWQEAKDAYTVHHGYEEPPTDRDVFWSMLAEGLLDAVINWPLPPEEETE
jgi:hypothetical protein